MGIRVRAPATACCKSVQSFTDAGPPPRGPMFVEQIAHRQPGIDDGPRRSPRGLRSMGLVRRSWILTTPDDSVASPGVAPRGPMKSDAQGQIDRRAPQGRR